MSDPKPLPGPFVYVAHKDGYWAGVCGEGEHAGGFIVSFVEEGFSVTTCNSREAYMALMGALEHWHKSPEWQAKQARKKASGQLKLFKETDWA